MNLDGLFWKFGEKAESKIGFFWKQPAASLRTKIISQNILILIQVNNEVHTDSPAVMGPRWLIYLILS
jgi:hypothetical protein